MRFEQYKYLRSQLLSGAEQSTSKSQESIGAMHSLVLAYIGDALFSIKVRMRLLEREKNKVRVLHDVGAKMVSAVMQSKAYTVVYPLLTEEELVIVRRARNAKSTVPRSATIHEYRQSTALEALLGYLFLSEQYERLDLLFNMSFECIMEHMVEAEMNK